MAYQALYRVWRPQEFADVVGQQHVTKTLQNALLQEKISHAYLFSGPRGTGKKNVELSERRGILELKITEPGFNLFSFNFNPDDVVIYLPKQFEEKLEIEMGSGSLRIEEYTNDQPLTLTSLSLDVGSGKSFLNHINSQSFSYDGSSGSVTIDSMTTEHGQFDISSGRVQLTSYEGLLEATLSSGSMDAQFDRLIDSIYVSISSGKVDLDLPSDADFTLKGKSSSGSISNQFPLEDQTTGNREISGIHGEGTHLIDLEVSSGRISVY